MPYITHTPSLGLGGLIALTIPIVLLVTVLGLMAWYFFITLED